MLERRARALESTKIKFGLKRFSFARGRDCGQLVAFHLGKLGRSLSIGSAGSYKDAAGAKRAVERLGFPNLPAFMDDRLERVPYARILVGDIVQMPAEPGEFCDLGALAVYHGSGTVFGYHADAQRPVVMKLLEPPVACWSAL